MVVFYGLEIAHIAKTAMYAPPEFGQFFPDGMPMAEPAIETGQGAPLKCPKCGLINLAGALSCECGYDFITHTWIAGKRRYPTHTDHLQGVGGWLLLFCIGTTILNPLILTLTPLPATLSPLGLVIVCAMTALSVYTGISLWRVASNALTWVKIYLAVSLGVQCLELFGELVRRPNTVGALVGIPATLAWLAYFMKSKRVRATFGSNLRGPRWL